MDLDGLAAVVDRGEGIRVRVPGFYVTDAGNLGPGPDRLSGEQVGGAAPPSQEEGRRGALGLGRAGAPAAAGPSRRGGPRRDRTASPACAACCEGARGAAIASFPTTVGGGQRHRAAAAGSRSAGRSAVRRGEPGPGDRAERGRRRPGWARGRRGAAAARVPRGALAERRPVRLRANAHGREQRRCAIADARRIQRALGVGRVGVSQVPSGIGDITIIVGEDFTG